ncbi:MAG: cupin domain-containing protein [Gammaproteobacteria bacterium]|nr:cupin domain-containing protein [Gammaproteobacteria bacterium]
MSEADLNGDTSRRLLVHASEMEWTASPAGGVERKRYHRVGPPEAGQVTSLVRYLPGSSFPRHGHPEGEEILVLEGVFTDHRGDFPRGSWLASPEGFEHAPSSDPGCLLFAEAAPVSGRSARGGPVGGRSRGRLASRRPGRSGADPVRPARLPRPDHPGALAGGAQPGAVRGGRSGAVPGGRRDPGR